MQISEETDIHGFVNGFLGRMFSWKMITLYQFGYDITKVGFFIIRVKG
jgi:hypothetical protein